MSKNASLKKSEMKRKTSLLPSEYKIGKTTYIVHIHFNLECSETLEDVLKRIMLREVERQVA